MFTKYSNYSKIKLMGKCKKRTLYSKENDYFMTREEAVNKVFNLFSKKSKINCKKAIETISLFGLSAEELSEAGVSYENLRAIDSYLN